MSDRFICCATKCVVLWRLLLQSLFWNFQPSHSCILSASSSISSWLVRACLSLSDCFFTSPTFSLLWKFHNSAGFPACWPLAKTSVGAEMAFSVLIWRFLSVLWSFTGQLLERGWWLPFWVLFLLFILSYLSFYLPVYLATVPLCQQQKRFRISLEKIWSKNLCQHLLSPFCKPASAMVWFCFKSNHSLCLLPRAWFFCSKLSYYLPRHLARGQATKIISYLPGRNLPPRPAPTSPLMPSATCPNHFFDFHVEMGFVLHVSPPWKISSKFGSLPTWYFAW